MPRLIIAFVFGFAFVLFGLGVIILLFRNLDDGGGSPALVAVPSPTATVAAKSVPPPTSAPPQSKSIPPPSNSTPLPPPLATAIPLPATAVPADTPVPPPPAPTAPPPPPPPPPPPTVPPPPPTAVVPPTPVPTAVPSYPFTAFVIGSQNNCGVTQLQGAVVDTFGSRLDGYVVQTTNGAGHDPESNPSIITEAPAFNWEQFIGPEQVPGNWTVWLMDSGGNQISNRVTVTTDDGRLTGQDCGVSGATRNTWTIDFQQN